LQYSYAGVWGSSWMISSLNSLTRSAVSDTSGRISGWCG